MNLKSFSDNLIFAVKVLQQESFGNGLSRYISDRASCTEFYGEELKESLRQYRKGFWLKAPCFYMGSDLKIQITISPIREVKSRVDRPPLLTEARFIVNERKLPEFYRCYLLDTSYGNYDFYKLRNIYEQVAGVLLFIEATQGYAEKDCVSSVAYDNECNKFLAYIVYTFVSQATNFFKKQFSVAIQGISQEEYRVYENEIGRITASCKSMATFVIRSWKEKVQDTRFPFDENGEPNYLSIGMYETLYPRFIMSERGLLIELYSLTGPGTISDVHFTNIQRFTSHKEKAFFIEKDKISAAEILKGIKSVLDYCKFRINP